MSNPTKPAFLSLSAEQQSQIVTTLAQTLGRSPEVLYKDVWVVWTLQHLFALPDAPTMVFKGGTSLSKAYGAIARFSEDIDITVDHHDLAPDIDPLASGISKTERKRRITALKLKLQGFVRDRLKPYFEGVAEAEGLTGVEVTFQTGDGPESLDANLEISFPKLGLATGGYYRDHVLIELGTRNPLEPNSTVALTADIASNITALSFPTAPNVAVLAAERTFWEKVTLIHDEVLRGEFRQQAKRLARHWSDVARLMQSDIGRQALTRRDLLEAVVETKKLYWSCRTSNYDACLRNAWQLLPEEDARDGLRADYQQMLDNAMFYDDPLTFPELLDIIGLLQTTLNTPANQA